MNPCATFEIADLLSWFNICKAKGSGNVRVKRIKGKKRTLQTFLEWLEEDSEEAITWLVENRPHCIEFSFPPKTPYSRYDTRSKVNIMKRWGTEQPYGIGDIYKLNHVTAQGHTVCILAGRGFDPDQFIDVFPMSQLVTTFIPPTISGEYGD